MGQPAARVGDSTLHGGKVLSGHPTVIIGGLPAAHVGAAHICPIHPSGPVSSGSDKVIIGGKAAARMQDFAACVPAALSDTEMLTSAQTTLACSQNRREELSDDDDARRQWLLEQALRDFNAGASALEIFSNTVQRSRWANTKVSFFGKPYIDSGVVAVDLGLLFVGYDGLASWVGDKIFAGDNRDNRYSINQSQDAVRPNGKHGLPFTGFKDEFRDDDPDSLTRGEDDQTHHLAFFTMIGAQRGSIVAKGGSVICDSDAQRDRALGYEGGMLGAQLGDMDLDINAYIWSRLGDPANGASKKSSDVIVTGFERVVIGSSTTISSGTPQGDAASLSRAGSVSNSNSSSNNSSVSVSSSSADSSASSSSH